MTNEEIRDPSSRRSTRTGDALHEGLARPAALRVLRPGRRDARRDGVEYAALDILPDPRIRQELSALSGWPTIPQLFVDGELVGGCDIVTEMFESGELAETLGVPQPELEQAPPPRLPASRRRSDRLVGRGCGSGGPYGIRVRDLFSVSLI